MSRTSEVVRLFSPENLACIWEFITTCTKRCSLLCFRLQCKISIQLKPSAVAIKFSWQLVTDWKTNEKKTINNIHYSTGCTLREDLISTQQILNSVSSDLFQEPATTIAWERTRRVTNQPLHVPVAPLQVITRFFVERIGNNDQVTKKGSKNRKNNRNKLRNGTRKARGALHHLNA